MSKWSWLITLVICGVSAFAFGRLKGEFAFDTDDAYITYRYAQHIAAGDGFVYNAGERVLGTTTPLYTLLLAAAAVLGADIPGASGMINVVAVAVTLALVYFWLAWRSGRMLVGLLGVAALLSFEQFVQFSISGMETSLYTLLIVLTFVLYDRSRYVLAAVVAGLCVLVRMDGAVVGVSLLLHYLIARRRLPGWRVVLGYVLTILPWFVFAYLYFGDVRPQSMLAKNQHMLESSRFWMAEFLFSYRSLVFWPLIIVGLGYALRRGRSLPGVVAFALWGALYVTAYTAYRIDLYLWYLSPLTVAVAVLAALGVGQAFAALEPVMQARSRFTPLGTTVLLLLALAPILTVRMNNMQNVIRGAIHWTDTLEQSRSDVAQCILEHGLAGDVVATGAIGIVGWETQAYIYDLLGLVTRNAVGRPLDENLADSGARWYVSQMSRGDPVIPDVQDFRLVGKFDRHSNVAFLLYEKDVEGWRRRQGAPVDVDLTMTNGLTIKTAELDDEALKVTLVADRPVEEALKYFVHVYRPADRDRSPYQLCDFYPTTPTSHMTPSVTYEDVVCFTEPLPSDGAVVRFGLFDESDPGLRRARSTDGIDQVELIYAGEAGHAPETVRGP